MIAIKSTETGSAKNIYIENTHIANKDDILRNSCAIERCKITYYKNFIRRSYTVLLGSLVATIIIAILYIVAVIVHFINNPKFNISTQIFNIISYAVLAIFSAIASLSSVSAIIYMRYSNSFNHLIKKPNLSAAIEAISKKIQRHINPEWITSQRPALDTESLKIQQEAILNVINDQYKDDKNIHAFLYGESQECIESNNLNRNKAVLFVKLANNIITTLPGYQRSEESISLVQNALSIKLISSIILLQYYVLDKKRIYQENKDDQSITRACPTLMALLNDINSSLTELDLSIQRHGSSSINVHTLEISTHLLNSELLDDYIDLVSYTGEITRLADADGRYKGKSLNEILVDLIHKNNKIFKTQGYNTIEQTELLRTCNVLAAHLMNQCTNNVSSLSAFDKLRLSIQSVFDKTSVEIFSGKAMIPVEADDQDSKTLCEAYNSVVDNLISEAKIKHLSQIVDSYRTYNYDHPKIATHNSSVNTMNSILGKLFKNLLGHFTNIKKNRQLTNQEKLIEQKSTAALLMSEILNLRYFTMNRMHIFEDNNRPSAIVRTTAFMRHTLHNIHKLENDLLSMTNIGLELDKDITEGILILNSILNDGLLIDLVELNNFFIEKTNVDSTQLLLSLDTSNYENETVALENIRLELSEQHSRLSLKRDPVDRYAYSKLLTKYNLLIKDIKNFIQSSDFTNP